MCMEDIRLGRELAANPVIQVAGSPGVVCRRDAKRTRIIVSADGVANCSIYPHGLNGGQFRGVILTTAHPVIVMRVEDWGPLLWEQWDCDDGGVGVTLTIVLCTLEKQ